jgi:predicted nucleotidyltransferase
MFGSRATGEQREGSDAAVTVMAGRELELLERERIADRLARVLGAPEVDLVVLDRAGLELSGTVVQEGRLLFSADEPRWVAFAVRTRSEYLDFLPTLRAHTRRYLRQIASTASSRRWLLRLERVVSSRRWCAIATSRRSRDLPTEDVARSMHVWAETWTRYLPASACSPR